MLVNGEEKETCLYKRWDIVSVDERDARRRKPTNFLPAALPEPRAAIPRKRAPPVYYGDVAHAPGRLEGRVASKKRALGIFQLAESGRAPRLAVGQLLENPTFLASCSRPMRQAAIGFEDRAWLRSARFRL